MKGLSIRLLLRVGRKVAGSGSSATVHRFGLFAAGASLVLFTWILLVASATFHERDGRATAREGIPTQSVADTAGYWVPSVDSLDDRQFSLVYLARAAEGAKPPPGLNRWPEPGEVFLSPELAAAAGPEFAQRYGSYAGSVKQAGLLYPSEWLAYVGADEGTLESRPGSAVSHFGATGRLSSTSLGTLNLSYTKDFLPVVLPLVGLPTLALCLVAARAGAEERDRRISVLLALGASIRARSCVLVGNGLAPVSMGAVFGCLIASISMLVSIRLPATGYIISASDAVSVGWTLPIIALGATVLLLMAIAFLNRQSTTTAGPRPRRSERNRRWPAAGLSLSAALMVAGASITGVPSRFLIAAGICLLGLSLPSIVGNQANRLGSVIANLGRRFNASAAIVGGRWLQARPETFSRMVSAFTVGLLLAAVVQVVITRAPDEVRSARLAQQALGGRIVVTRSTGLTMQGSLAFTHAIGEEKVLYLREGDGEPTLSASCATLALVGAIGACPAEPMALSQVFAAPTDYSQALQASIGEDAVVSATLPTLSDQIDLLVILNGDGEPGVDRIREAAFRLLPVPFVTLPGDDWVIGWANLNRLARWPLDLEIPGVLLLVLAGLLAVGSTYLSQVRSLGPVSAFTTQRRFFMQVAAWNLAVPLAVTALVASGAVIAVAELLRRIYGSDHSAAGFVLILGAAVVAVGLVFAFVCGWLGAAVARQWRPVPD